MTFIEFMAALLGGGTAGLLGGQPRRLVPRHRLAPYIPGTLVYYTRDASTHFRFRFVREASGAIRVYILEQPSYGGRDTAARMTHRLGNPGLRYICFEPPIRTVEDARQVARTWSELTLRYIRIGQAF